jgi:hypothetical protein
VGDNDNGSLLGIQQTGCLDTRSRYPGKAVEMVELELDLAIEKDGERNSVGGAGRCCLVFQTSIFALPPPSRLMMPVLPTSSPTSALSRVDGTIILAVRRRWDQSSGS